MIYTCRNHNYINKVKTSNNAVIKFKQCKECKLSKIVAAFEKVSKN
jgi:hypothetical protein